MIPSAPDTRQPVSENAAKRRSFTGDIYQAGVDAAKRAVLDSIPADLAALHRDGAIHIHDLEAYGRTYNCLTVNVEADFPLEEARRFSPAGRVHAFFDYLRFVIANLACEQPGGIGFANVDLDAGRIYERLGVPPSHGNVAAARDAVFALLGWVNGSRTRYGQEPYYFTLNLGLATDDWGRAVTRCVLELFRDSGPSVIRPNVVFKVKRELHLDAGAPNADLYRLALECTARKMIPTYVLCDAAPNAGIDPERLAVMGCRTRVVANRHGGEGAIGRGNIAYVSVNLPRIALECANAGAPVPTAEVPARMAPGIERVFEAARGVLIDRYRKTLESVETQIPFNLGRHLWVDPFDGGVENVLRQGTLAIGFIGLSEVFEILTGGRHHETAAHRAAALEIADRMRSLVDRFRDRHDLNFSLLATSAEQICGRFPELDARRLPHPCQRKGYYTNSFHVGVGEGVSPFVKLDVEGPFHRRCNGGCITYVEFASAPLSNVEALDDLARHGIDAGVHYLGFNYPLDVCRACGTPGTFDACPACGGADVRRIRRVSGYLEEYDRFTRGKTAEAAERRPNDPRPGS